MFCPSIANKSRSASHSPPVHSVDASAQLAPEGAGAGAPSDHDALRSLTTEKLHYAPRPPALPPSAGSSTHGNRLTALKQRIGKLRLPINEANSQKIGTLIGKGVTGEVLEDPENPAFVIKSFGRKSAESESKLFNMFYGEFSSEVFEKNGQTFMRMLRVPGKPLNQFAHDELPLDSDNLFCQMICDMNDLKIMHGDLHAGNVMYDSDTHRFWPIDFSNSYDAYYANQDLARVVDLDNKQRFEQIMNALPGSAAAPR